MLFGGVSTAALGVLAVMISLTVIFWTADSLFSGSFKIPSKQLLLPFIGLILLGLIQMLPLGNSGVTTDLLAAPVSGSLSINSYATMLAVVKLCLFLIFFAACFTFFDTPKRLKNAVFVLIVFGAFMSFIGILQKLSNPDLILWFRQVDYAQPFATYVNQHHFAAFLEMTIALTLGLLFAGSTRPDKRVLLIIAVVLMGLGIVFTTSRGAMMSLVAILGLLTLLSFWSGRKSKSRRSKNPFLSRVWILVGANAALVIFLLVSAAFLGGSDLILRGTGLNGPKDFSNGRFEFWMTTLEIVKDNPLIGTGLDTFEFAYTRYDEWNGEIRINHAHNEYLNMLSEAGIVGFLLVISFIVLLFKEGIKTIRTTHHPYRRGIAAGALAGCFGILVHSFFDFPLRTNANMFFFLICAVLATARVDFPPVVRRKQKQRAEG